MASDDAAGRARALRLAMVETQLRARRIADPAVLGAFERVPRELFVPGEPLEEAYADHPVAIPCGQSISQPYVVAYMCQILGVRPGDRALDVGAGSGYTAAILAELGASVIAIERMPELADRAREHLSSAGYADRVTVRVGDGTCGFAAGAPYAKILVSAATPAVPSALVDELDPERGVLVAPVGGEKEQIITAVRKTRAGVQTATYGKCAFVKLLGREGFPTDDD